MVGKGRVVLDRMIREASQAVSKLQTEVRKGAAGRLGDALLVVGSCLSYSGNVKKGPRGSENHKQGGGPWG